MENKMKMLRNLLQLQYIFCGKMEKSHLTPAVNDEAMPAMVTLIHCYSTPVKVARIVCGVVYHFEYL